MSKKACVLIHGFTGSPRDIEIIAEHLKNKGFEVSTPILAGHSIDMNRWEMSKFTWSDWIASAETALKALSEKNDYEELYLVGYSMGGVIAAHLATKYPIKKLVLISASYFYTNPKSLIKNFNRIHFTKAELSRYIYKFKHTPLKATINFRKLVKELSPSLINVEVPTLIIQGEMDDLVDPSSAEYIYNTVRSKEKSMHLLPKSKHFICWDCEKEIVVELVDKFLD